MKYLLSACVVLTANAQSNFKPGYIISLQGDTLRGDIDYREWQSNPAQVKFKSLNTTGLLEVKPENVRGFGLNAFEHYQSVTTTFSKNSLRVSELTSNVDTARFTATVFLKIIASGQKITLYSFTDNIKQRFFVSELGSGQPEELIYQPYILNGQIQRKNTYVRQLQRLAALYQPDDQKLLQKIQSSNYSLADIAKIVYAINGIAAQKDASNPGAGSTRFFVGLGLNASSVRFRSAEFGSQGVEDYESQGSKWSYFPQINIGFDVMSNKSVPKLFFRIELNASANSAKFISTSTWYATSYEQEFSFTRYFVNLQPQLVYNVYNSEKIKFFVAAGAGLHFSAYSPVVNEERGTTNNTTTIVSKPAIPQNFPKTGVQVITRAGVTLQRFEIYGLYNPEMGLAPPLTYSLRLTSYGFGVNYFLGK